jgi:hypothetical protein
MMYWADRSTPPHVTCLASRHCWYEFFLIEDIPLCFDAQNKMVVFRRNTTIRYNHQRSIIVCDECVLCLCLDGIRLSSEVKEMRNAGISCSPNSPASLGEIQTCTVEETRSVYQNFPVPVVAQYM